MSLWCNCLFAGSILWLTLAGLGTPPAAEAQDASSRFPSTSKPLSPQESLAAFRLADDRLQVEIVACEPEVIDPVAGQFDEQGRLWVVEMRDYPFGPKQGEQPKSRIKLLEDRDGDGRFETATIFADQLLFVTELLPWRGGVIATVAGEVLFLKDSDGDGRVDVRETWYQGFAQENSQLRANHPRLGLDGWVYVSNGLRGGTVIDPRKPGAVAVPLAGKDFRFDPHSFAYEAVTGVGQFGLTFDDFGNRFICSNRNPLMHVVLEERFIARNPQYAPAAARHDVGPAGEVSRIYAISRAWTTSNLHAGQFTAACGVLVFRGAGLPAEYQGNGLTCDPTGNLIHREVMLPDGATFKHRPTAAQVEFLASPDEWFRPVNQFLGPDGSLYVVDMYRAVIEHPDFMPEELKRRPDLMLGIDRGRIYRIRGKTAPRQLPPRLDQATGQELVAALDQSGWHADTAYRLLSQRQDKTVVPELRQAARQTSAVGAVRALWLLHQLDAIPADLLSHSLAHPDARVREQAVLIADARQATDAALRQQLVRLAGDPDAKVRFGVLLALAPAATDDEVAAIQQAALSGVDDVWTRRAAAIAIGSRGAELVRGILAELPRQDQPFTAGQTELLRDLTVLAGRHSAKDEASALLAAILAIPDRRGEALVQRVLLRSLAESLARQSLNLRSLAGTISDPALQRKLEQVFAAADQAVRSPNAALDERMEAIQLVAHDPEHVDDLTLVALNREAGGGYPLELRQLAVAALSRSSKLDPWRDMLAGWSAESAPFRRAMLDGLMSRPERVALLLDAIEAAQVRPAEIETSYVNRLLKQGRAEMRERAGKLLASAVPADRQQVLASYQGVLEMKAEPLRGREVFAKNCATCHRIGDLGVNVAPDISDSRVKQPEQLLADILQPNRAIDANYLSYTVVTADGLTLTGIIAAETGTSVTLRQQEGKDVTLVRDQIEDLRSNGISLMPDGLEKNIPPQDMADLISFIKNWRYLDGRTPLGP